MGHELLHVFKDAQRQRLVHSRKVVEELRERSAVFQIVEQGPNRYACPHENGDSTENVRIRMYARNLAFHASSLPDVTLPSIRPGSSDGHSGVAFALEPWRLMIAAGAIGCKRWLGCAAAINLPTSRQTIAKPSSFWMPTP